MLAESTEMISVTGVSEVELVIEAMTDEEGGYIGPETAVLASCT